MFSIQINNNLLEQTKNIFKNFYNRSNKLTSFTSIIKISGGGTPRTTEPKFWNGDIPFFTPKDVGFPFTILTEKNITEEGLNRCNSKLYPSFTTFVTARGTVGKVALAGKPMAMNQSCYALESNQIDPILVYHYVLETVKALKHKASGAVFDAIVTRDFESESINLLSISDENTFLSIAKPMYEIILSQTIENKNLAEFRDTLLPKLMSGELDVSELDV